jgi:hypothetical protein
MADVLQISGTVIGEGPMLNAMLNAWSRAEDYRDLAKECRRLAATTLSSQMKDRYLLMAKDYILLAAVEEQANACRTQRRLQKMPMIREPLT